MPLFVPSPHPVSLAFPILESGVIPTLSETVDETGCKSGKTRVVFSALQLQRQQRLPFGSCKQGAQGAQAASDIETIINTQEVERWGKVEVRNV